MKKRLRVIVLMHSDFLPPASIEGLSEKETAPFQTEYDVVSTLRKMGHDVHPLGVSDDFIVIRQAIIESRPDVVFNLLEEFRGLGEYVPFVLGYLELMRQPYTGCNPYGLLIARNKALTKNILRYHRVRMPDFHVFPRGQSIKPPRRFHLPAIVKSTTEQGSVGISQASVVASADKLVERVQFVHDQLQTDAIVEEYIDGRELYVGVLGHRRLLALPVWEMLFQDLPDGAPRIATERVKWNADYQKQAGIVTQAAAELPDGVERRIVNTVKRVYRLLGLSGYARMDLRLRADGQLFLLEANPNPQLSAGEDFAESANAVGLEYPDLIARILHLASRYNSRPP
ncbi:MAG: ATP-grasp domain-containing protein [Phycisphaerales bacterium]|nr:ATP-grasp domain-containing protein [Phycisphaerales bacterium]